MTKRTVQFNITELPGDHQDPKVVYDAARQALANAMANMIQSMLATGILEIVDGKIQPAQTSSNSIVITATPNE